MTAHAQHPITAGQSDTTGTEHLQAELLELTSQLMTFRSTADRSEEIQHCADFIAAWLKTNGISCLRLEQNGVPSILVGAGAGAKVLLLAHFDVVNGPDELFEPRVENGILYGRGSNDDKYAVAMSLLLYREHWREHIKNTQKTAALPFMLLFTGDEEVGGNNGAGYAASLMGVATPSGQRLCPPPAFCLALDGGSPQEIITRQKGVLRVALTESGKAAHGAYLWLGENAAIKLARDCLRVADFFQQIQEQGQGESLNYWYPTCNIGLLRAGQVVNQVPDKARADFDVRYTEKQNPAELFQAMQNVVEEGRLEILANIPPLMPIPSPFLDLLQSCAPKARIGVGHGASDAQFFSRQGIACAVWGAQGNGSQHGPMEHLNLASAFALMDCLDKFLRKLY